MSVSGNPSAENHWSVLLPAKRSTVGVALTISSVLSFGFAPGEGVGFWPGIGTPPTSIGPSPEATIWMLACTGWISPPEKTIDA